MRSPRGHAALYDLNDFLHSDTVCGLDANNSLALCNLVQWYLNPNRDHSERANETIELMADATQVRKPQRCRPAQQQ